MLAAADFEQWLRKIVKQVLKEADHETLEKLKEKDICVSSPIRGLRATIDIALRLGLVDTNDSKRLRYVTKIRNEFAHLAKPMNFADQPICDWCRNISGTTTQGSHELLEEYLAFLGKLKSQIQDKLDSTERVN